MLKKTIKFDDVDGQERTEVHYFHLSKADLIKMEVAQKGGLQKHLERVIESEDGKQIIEIFENLIRQSYGQRTEDGRFLRDPQKATEFLSSEAYSELFMSLVTDAEAAAEFVNGIIPKGLDEQATQIIAKQSADIGDAEEKAEDPTGLTKTVTPEIITTTKLMTMDPDDLKAGLADGRYKMGMM